MGDYVSNELFHFVGHATPSDNEENYRKLLLVLGSGWVSAPPHRPQWDNESYGIDHSKRLESGALIVPSVTCFCDIPVEHLDIHIRKYGPSGVSFRRTFLARHGARPVMYIPMNRDDWRSIYGRNLLADMEACYKSFLSLCDEVVTDPGQEMTSTYAKQTSDPLDAREAVKKLVQKHFFAFIKPFDVDLPSNDSDNYYMEREWRRLGNVKASPATVVTVLVASGFEDRLRKDAPLFGDRVHTPESLRLLSGHKTGHTTELND